MGAGKSTVAAAIRDLFPTVVMIEVDDVKEMIHGSRMRCDPERVFRKAGAQAKEAMDAGRDVVVIEPLCTREHIRFVLGEAGVSEASSSVLSVWLDCTLQSAIARKSKDFSSGIIEGQHRRYSDRCVLENEATIRTDDLSPTEVLQRVCLHFQLGVEK
jgi:chloramphenicol 3-O-phosphotransferase